MAKAKRRARPQKRARSKRKPVSKSSRGKRAAASPAAEPSVERIHKQPLDPAYARVVESMKEADRRGAQERERATQARKAIDQAQARRDRPRVTVTVRPRITVTPAQPKITVTPAPVTPRITVTPAPVVIQQSPSPSLTKAASTTTSASRQRGYGPAPQLSPTQIEQGEALLVAEWNATRNLTNKDAVKFLRDKLTVKESVVSDRRLIEDIITPARRRYRVTQSQQG